MYNILNRENLTKTSGKGIERVASIPLDVYSLWDYVIQDPITYKEYLAYKDPQTGDEISCETIDDIANKVANSFVSYNGFVFSVVDLDRKIYQYYVESIKEDESWKKKAVLLASTNKSIALDNNIKYLSGEIDNIFSFENYTTNNILSSSSKHLNIKTTTEAKYYDANISENDIVFIKDAKIDADNKQIINVETPINNTDAANKNYVDIVSSNNIKYVDNKLTGYYDKTETSSNVELSTKFNKIDAKIAGGVQYKGELLLSSINTETVDGQLSGISITFNPNISYDKGSLWVLKVTPTITNIIINDGIISEGDYCFANVDISTTEKNNTFPLEYFDFINSQDNDVVKFTEDGIIKVNSQTVGLSLSSSAKLDSEGDYAPLGFYKNTNDKTKYLGIKPATENILGSVKFSSDFSNALSSNGEVISPESIRARTNLLQTDIDNKVKIFDYRNITQAQLG